LQDSLCVEEMETQTMEALIEYLKAHPLAAVVLALVIGLFIGSLFKKLIKAALILGIILLVGLYFTHEQASEEWRAEADMLLKKAEEKAREYGQEALEKGQEALEEHLPDKE